MGFGDRKEELPALEVCAGTGGGETALIDVLHGGKGGVGFRCEALSSEFIIDIIVDAPQPFGHIGLALGRIRLHVLGQALATPFAGEDIGDDIEEVAYVLLGKCIGGETDEVQESPTRWAPVAGVHSLDLYPDMNVLYTIVSVVGRRNDV
jgi:hypothetical protein